MKKIFFMFLVIFSVSFAWNYKLIETETVKDLKYSTTAIVNFNEKISRPSKEVFDKIGTEIIKKNPNYESYFINYYYPGMDMQSASLASTIKQDGEQKTEVLLWTLSYDPFYSKYVDYDDEGNLYWAGLNSTKMKEKAKEDLKNQFLVNFSARVKIDRDLGVKVFVTTNLPEGTILNVSLYPGNFSEDISINSEGKAETFYLNTPDGKYYLNIVSIAENLQENEEVRRVFGEDGKNLKGKHIKKDMFGSFLDYKKIIKVKRGF